ncbi:MAG TPA: fatty acid desaturase [Gammaproteobacteria bacterium]|nr:fatty acid desaturase [Gammaproteobacteria bacterium]
MAKSHYINKKEIKHLARTSDLVGLALVLHCWGMVIAMMAIFIIWPNPLTFIAAALIIGGRQLGMAILMHDAAHGVLFKTKSLNRFFGRFFLGYPIGADMDAYREYHLKHHLYAQRENDPDLGLSAPFPIKRASFVRKILRDLSGMTALKLRFGQLLMTYRQKATAEPADRVFEIKTLAWPYLTNLILFAGFYLAGYWWLYFALWLLPLFTVFQLFLRIRNIAEHALTTNDDNPLTHARTTLANPLERLFVAPYWVNYHIEHHVYMYVPCWRLKQLHMAMLNNGYEKDMEIKPSYRAVLNVAIIN